MNKLFTKIASLALGAAMAFGVGVAVASNSKEATPVHATDTYENLTYASTSGTYFEYSLAQNGGSNAPNHSSDIRIYNKNTLTISAKSTYSSSVSITSVDITGKNSKSGKTQTVYFDPAGGTYVTSGSNVTWGTGTGSATRTATFTGSNLTSVVFYQAGPNNVQISNLKVYFTLADKTLSSIAVSGATTSFTVGDTFSFGGTVTATYSDSTTADVTSSATFSGYNMSTAGNQTVTASYTEGGVTRTATYGITVSAATSPFITPEKASASGYTGQNESISFTYGNLTGSLGVTSSNTSIVTVGSPSYNAGEGSVQFNYVGAGSTTVKFKEGSTELASVSVSVTASSVTITGLAATSSAYIGKTLNLGSTITVTATGIYTNAVTWESEDDDIATVSDAGVVTGVAEGTVDITVTSDDYPSATMTCTVTVESAPIADLLRTASTSLNYTTNSYGSVSEVTKTGHSDITSEATYAGYFMCATSPNTGAIQLNPSKSSYICTTASSQLLSSIAVTFINANGKGVAFYGSNTAYTASYTAYGSVSGTELDVLTADGSFNVSGDYKYLYIVPTGTTYVGTIEITWRAAAQLSSVTTSGQTASFTQGGSFAYGGTLTAHYTQGKADATVTPTQYKYGASGFNPASAGTAITIGTTLSVDTHNGKYVSVGYTEGGITKWSALYQITVSYAAVSSVTLSQNTAEIGLGETFDYREVVVTVSPANANQAVTWSVDTETTTATGYTFNSSGLTAGQVEGIVTLKCTSDADATKYATLVVTVTGDPTAAFDKESTSGYAGKTEVIEFTYGNISDVSKITVASSNTSYVSVEDDLIAEDGVGLVTINFVAEGSANVTISYDGGSTLDTLTVSVSADSVSSISVKTNPTKTTYTVGETFSATGLVISASMASGDTVDLASNQYNLRNAPTVLNDKGVQTITVELVADTTKTTSFNITVNMPSGLKIVTKTSNNDGGYEATLLTSSNTLSAGMKVAIGSSTKEDLMGTYGTGNNVKPLSGDGITVTYDSTNSKYTFDGTGANAAVYTLGGNSSDGWTFTDSSGNYLYKPTGTNNYMKAASSTDNNILWDISLDAEGVATITNKGNTTNNLMARNKTSDLYSCYASTSTAIVGIELYQVSELDPTYSYNAIDLSETIYDFIRVVYNNSDYYTCQSGGEGSSLTNWSNITSNAKYTALTSADKQNLANAVVSSPDGTKNSSEMVADFLSQYNYVVWKYGKSYDYLGRVDAGTASVRQTINLLGVMMGENTNTVAIIVIISMVSVTAIGGYFFLKKRKENI